MGRIIATSAFGIAPGSPLLPLDYFLYFKNKLFVTLLKTLPFFLPLFLNINMAISRTQQEAINKLCETRPTEHIGKFFKTPFPESTPVACRAALLCDALALFKEL